MSFEWFDFSSVDLFWVVLFLLLAAMWSHERYKNKQLTAIVAELQAKRSEEAENI